MNRASILQLLSRRKLLLLIPVLLAPGAMPYIPVSFEGTYRSELMAYDCGMGVPTENFMEARDGWIVFYRLYKDGSGTVTRDYDYRTGADGVVSIYRPASRPGDSGHLVMKAYPRLTGTRFESMEDKRVYQSHKFSPDGVARKALDTAEIFSQEMNHPDFTTTREVYSPDFRWLRTEIREKEIWKQLTAGRDPEKR